MLFEQKFIDIRMPDGSINRVTYIAIANQNIVSTLTSTIYQDTIHPLIDNYVNLMSAVSGMQISRQQQQGIAFLRDASNYFNVLKMFLEQLVTNAIRSNNLGRMNEELRHFDGIKAFLEERFNGRNLATLPPSYIAANEADPIIFYSFIKGGANALIQASQPLRVQLLAQRQAQLVQVEQHEQEQLEIAQLEGELTYWAGRAEREIRRAENATVDQPADHRRDMGRRILDGFASNGLFRPELLDRQRVGLEVFLQTTNNIRH